MEISEIHGKGYIHYKKHYYNFVPNILDENKNLNDQTIVSFPSLFYGLDNMEIINQIDFYALNVLLRNNSLETPTECHIISNCIHKSPKINISFTVYRGLPHSLQDLDWEKGQIITNLGFMFSSINKSIAQFYANYDTSSCYLSNNSIDLSKAKKLPYKGTLLEISIPKDVPFIELSTANFCTQNSIDNQIILDYKTELKIINIHSDQNLIVCEARMSPDFKI